MDQKLAIIDLGTNTFHLLIARSGNSGHEILERERSAVKIGVGGINQDIIQEEAIERAVKALHAFKVITDKHSIPVSKIFAFGTSALRNAKNSNDVVQRIKAGTDIDITIISGDHEADLIYKGVRSAVNLGHEPSLIIDIGGGSVEFILANEDEIFWKKSFEIGGQRLLERFQKHDPILSTEIMELDKYLEQALQELFLNLKKFNPSTLVGSSGTFDTLSEIHCIRHNILYQEENPETPLSLESFFIIYKELILKNRSERLAIPGMIEMRVDMIVVASCLIRFLLEKHVFETLRVSTYSLKEGVLAGITPPRPSPYGEGGVRQ
ncbi:MAG TPA: exopolyphosphatase [Cyclobacteriaceae bacterium]|nr:exopolyphosphatase [Cyclobacteriaceae bacterium]